MPVHEESIRAFTNLLLGKELTQAQTNDTYKFMKLAVQHRILMLKQQLQVQQAETHMHWPTIEKLEYQIKVGTYFLNTMDFINASE